MDITIKNEIVASVGDGWEVASEYGKTIGFFKVAGKLSKKEAKEVVRSAIKKLDKTGVYCNISIEKCCTDSGCDVQVMIVNVMEVNRNFDYAVNRTGNLTFLETYNISDFYRDRFSY